MSGHNKAKLYGVLTSDIVHSTKLSPAQYSSAMKTLKQVLQLHQTRFNTRYEIFRGDSFQVMYPDIDVAMMSVLAIRLYLQSGKACPAIKLTQSFAIGTIDQASDELSSSLGEAYLTSGRMLDKAARGDFMVNLGPAGNSQDLQLSTLFLHNLINGLTEKQSEVLYYYLDANFPEQHIIAERLGMTRQNVATHLKRGGAELIKAYLTAYHDFSLGIQP